MDGTRKLVEILSCGWLFSGFTIERLMVAISGFRMKITTETSDEELDSFFNEIICKARKLEFNANAKRLMRTPLYLKESLEDLINSNGYSKAAK